MLGLAVSIFVVPSSLLFAIAESRRLPRIDYLLIKQLSNGGITPGFSAIWGYCKMRPRQALPRAQACPKCNSEALVRRPYAHAEHAHTFCFFSAMFLSLTLPRRKTGQKDPPFCLQVGGGYTPANLLRYMYTLPHLASISAHLTAHSPFFYHFVAAAKTTTST